MFRAISLVETTDDADLETIVRAARAMVAEDPNVVRGEVMAGLRRMRSRYAEASYTMVLDFEDEAAWRRYGTGEPHARFSELVAPVITRVTLAEYVVGDEAR